MYITSKYYCSCHSVRYIVVYPLFLIITKIHTVVSPDSLKIEKLIICSRLGPVKYCYLTHRCFQVTVVSVESPRTPSILPRTGDVVTAKVTVVNPRMVQCVILCVGSSVLVRPYRGILKKEDIKATEKDRVDPYKCYRPGDVILARVVSFLWLLSILTKNPSLTTHIY